MKAAHDRMSEMLNREADERGIEDRPPEVKAPEEKAPEAKEKVGAKKEPTKQVETGLEVAVRSTPSQSHPTGPPRSLAPVSTPAPHTGRRSSGEDRKEAADPHEEAKEEEKIRQQEEGSVRMIGNLQSTPPPMLPLFTQEQYMQLMQIHDGVPMMPRRETMLQRPEWMEVEEQKYQRIQEERERLIQYRVQEDIAKMRHYEQGGKGRHSMPAGQTPVDPQKMMMIEKMHRLEEENRVLREMYLMRRERDEGGMKAIVDGSSKYGTPEALGKKKEEEEEGGRFIEREMLVIGALAVIGLFHCLGSVWRLWRGTVQEREVAVREEEAEESLEDEEESLMRQRGEKALREEEDRLKKEKELRRREGKNVEGRIEEKEEESKQKVESSSEVRKDLEAKEGRRGAQSSTTGASSSTAQGAASSSVPMEVKEVKEDEKYVYLTEWGTRAHEERGCSSLKQSKRVYACAVCRVCAPVWDQKKPVYIHRKGQKAHQDIGCRAAEGKLWKIAMCQICSS
eukprot:Skav216258  [mRNA]  locus=scaffold20:509015:516558:- [translate_table: standard]